MNNCWKKLWCDEQGAVTVETALLLILIAVASVVAFTSLGGTVRDQSSSAIDAFKVSEVHP